MTDTTDPKGNKTANEAAGNPAQPGGRSVEQIERDIEVTRADMATRSRRWPRRPTSRPRRRRR